MSVKSYRPINLYRLQLHQGFTFYDALEILEYLKNLGIDSIYCSPVFQAKRGSMHGYDVINPTEFNQELGGEHGFEAFIDLAHSLGLGVLMDLVANHMAASPENPWWFDVLESGPYSLYSDYFDIDWNPPITALVNKVLAPVLGSVFKVALKEKSIQLICDLKGLFIATGGDLYPINPGSYSLLIGDIGALKDLSQSFDTLRESKEEDQKVERREKLKVLKKAFTEKLKEKEIFALVEKKIKEINNDIYKLEHFLDRQHVLFEFWQAASEQINYRRFFDINGLVALRMENVKAFREFHKLPIQLYQEKKIQGFRIDHPDGLYEPSNYFKHLKFICKNQHSPIIAEKILQKEESLPRKWLIQGSVGYEYLNLINQLFVDQSQEELFSNLYDRFLEQKVDRELMLQESKRNFAFLYMASEINAMSSILFKNKEKKYLFTCEEVKEAIVELYVFFPIYRSYLEKDTLILTSEEKGVFFEVFDRANLSKPRLKDVFQYLKELFFHKKKLSSFEENFMMRFQQIAPTMMAKGFEDTYLYNYNRFFSLNEVGGYPDTFGGSIEDFHEKMLFKQRFYPDGWITLSTHDTKKSCEIRLRLDVLSEIYPLWEEKVLSWKKENVIYKIKTDETFFPDLNREYFLYQILVGIWPAHPISEEEKSSLIDRIKVYLIKASRESKAYTNWLHHHTNYERALGHFIDKILEQDSSFLLSLMDVLKHIDFPAQLTTLSCLNLTLGLPGPLDVYQGTELWDFSLVDPDNRRKIDYKKRKECLLEIKAIKRHQDPTEWIKAVLKRKELEKLKFYIFSCGLHLRTKHKKLFLKGEYTPLKITGEKQNHIIGYIREYKESVVLVISSRFLSSYHDSKFWKKTTVTIAKKWQGIYDNIYTKQEIEVKETMHLEAVLEIVPFAFLMKRMSDRA